MCNYVNDVYSAMKTWIVYPVFQVVGKNVKIYRKVGLRFTARYNFEILVGLLYIV